MRCNKCSGLRILRAVALAGLIVVAPVIAAAAPLNHKEVRIPRVDRRAIETLQRWVNGGHDAWCKDASAVASAELRRIAPEFGGNRFDLVSLPLQGDIKTAKRAVFTWVTPDGSAQYRVTVKRYDWLKPGAKRVNNTVWVPSRVEVVRIEPEPPAKRAWPELPRA